MASVNHDFLQALIGLEVQGAKSTLVFKLRSYSYWPITFKVAQVIATELFNNLENLINRK